MIPSSAQHHAVICLQKTKKGVRTSLNLSESDAPVVSFAEVVALNRNRTAAAIAFEVTDVRPASCSESTANRAAQRDC
ncbi:MAG: hypothetical protein KDA85_08480 [Planctomycetaceae bacterium]|nr:hypothetical protein [Planctomycetaceae bacterium]